jgi:hypothetical protein
METKMIMPISLTTTMIPLRIKIAIAIIRLTLITIPIRKRMPIKAIIPTSKIPASNLKISSLMRNIKMYRLIIRETLIVNLVVKTYPEIKS